MWVSCELKSGEVSCNHCCNLTISRVTFSEEEYKEYSPLIDKYGLIEFMRMFNNNEIKVYRI